MVPASQPHQFRVATEMSKTAEDRNINSQEVVALGRTHREDEEVSSAATIARSLVPTQETNGWTQTDLWERPTQTAAQIKR